MHNQLQGLGIDPYHVGQLVPIGAQTQDLRLWGRCGGCFRCGGCGGCGGCFGFGFGCFGCFGCFGIGFGFI